jgi:hypothetical protein
LRPPLDKQSEPFTLRWIVERFPFPDLIQHEKDVWIFARHAASERAEKYEENNRRDLRAAIVSSDNDGKKKGQARQLSVKSNDQQRFV